MSATRIQPLDPRRVRPPAVAGRFYPGQPDELRRTVMALLAAVPPSDEPAPKALIVPHAGYPYSGPIAASAYARLARDHATIRRIVLLGPSHRDEFSGVAACTWEGFATPLGVVPVDGCALPRLSGLPQVVVKNEAHAGEHALEVQLPFLQCVLLEGFTVVPLLAGNASPAEIGAVLDLLWGGEETRVIISSDLSHYLEPGQARETDTRTAAAIEALRSDLINAGQACGRGPIRGMIEVARQHRLRATAVDLRHSGDTGGSRQQVVGYGAFIFRL